MSSSIETSSSTSSTIKLLNVKRSFILGGKQYDVLKGVNMTVMPGALLAIMGASGSGKSTLMNIIGLLDTMTSGAYYFEDRDVSTLSDNVRSTFRNQKMGFVFQSFFLLPRLTALNNVLLPLVYRGTPHTEAKQHALTILEKVGMARLAHSKPNQLSGGEQQRVAIARALVGKPTVLLADEPTGALDSKTSQEVVDLFINLNREEKVTTIIITHDPGVAEQCDRILRIKDGLIEE